jgi:signal transduction histidine kinase/ligand-binding sensor domain-containing protein
VEGSDSTIAQMYHRSWTARDGMPDSVWQVQQSSDGFLWLASTTGLVRFDGAHFRHYPASQFGFLSDNVIAVHGAKKGGLWIGYQFGGVSYFKDGQTHNYAPGQDGLPRGAVKEFAEREGVIWAITTSGLAQFDGSKWSTLGAEQGYRSSQNVRFFMDRFHDLWINDHSNSMQRLKARSNTFEDTGLPQYAYLSFTEGGDGWGSTGEGIAFLKRGSDGALYSHSLREPRQIDVSFVDHAGDLWLGSTEDGLYRLSANYAQHPGEIPKNWLDRFTSRDGLSGKAILAALEDREGGIWFVTDGGLDYFRRIPFHGIVLPDGINGISMALQGKQILTAFDGAKLPLYELGQKGLRPLAAPREPYSSLYKDASGCLWSGGDGHVYRSCGHDLLKLVFPGSDDGRTRLTQAIAVTRDGDAWISVLRETPLHWHDGRWDRDAKLATQPLRTPLTIFAASSGDVYFGYEHGVLLRRKADLQEQVLQDGQMRLGNITEINEKNDHLWLGGSNGLVMIRNGQPQQVLPSDDESLRGISGIVERDNGDLWLNTMDGAVLISNAEVMAMRRDPTHHVKTTRLNFLDGFPGAPQQIRPLSALLTLPDGRLLFAARAKLAWLDPDLLTHNTVAPGVSIDQMIVDGKATSLNSGIRLQPKPQDVSFDVAVGSLLIPERTRIRFQLHGLDDSWRDAGQDRRITYVRLQPGTYTLNLQSANDDNVLSNTVSFSFVVPPTFVQSRRFKALCAVLALVALWLALLLRVRYATERVRRDFAERRAERERLAGDLHDDFFQSIQGLLLRFQAATGSLSQSEPVRARLEDILAQSDQVMLEGRELVFELRTGSAALGNMAAALAELGSELESAHNRSFELKVEGEVRKLAPIPGEELLKIVRESLWNAFRHSQAKTITLVLRFDTKQLTVSVIDDGVGIGKSILDAGERKGHFGLPGMRERAKRIRGSVQVISAPQTGTRIVIHAPANIIYEQASRSFRDSSFK